MPVKYLLQRRLRHLRSVTLANVALLLNKEGNDNKLHREVIRTTDCFYIIENLKGEILLVSEIQGNPLRSVQFNDVNFNGDSTTRFIIKIVVQIPHELIAEHNPTNDTWCVTQQYIIDLNQLIPIDTRNDTVTTLNTPIFILDDGNYTVKEATMEKGILSSTLHPSLLESKLRTNTKISFTFNTVLKVNKLLEYIGQTQEETKRLSSYLERPLSHAHISQKINLEREELIKEQLNKLLLKKRAKIESLKEEIELHSTLIRSNTVSSVDIVDKTNVNDQYGTTYSNLFQTRNSLMHWRNKKLTQLISIFTVQQFFNLAKALNCDKYVSITMVTDEDSHDNTTNQQRITLKAIEKDKMQSQINISLQVQEQINTFLGYFLLLIDILSKNVFNIELPHKLMFYGSTSVIDKAYPLYLPPAYSGYNQSNFYEAIDLFNINIQQINQYLTDHYSNT
ncbi:hypothetical protein C6P45_000851 [Maudiozyma exigua]|uniref:Uncharacterized protein n=1 Tax=Maudiozyma exigua TaxID=34358 RepID=A0A9P6W386_MAUEX|nr:hypothetical protein C6P45_000851 [Kazachstania exigua]